MKIETDNVLLFIEPKQLKSNTPVDDDLTTFIEKILSIAMTDPNKSGIVYQDGRYMKGLGTRGVHTCICNEHSDPCDYEIYDGYYTNSLATHYLRWHRDEVPMTEIDKVKTLMTKTSSL